MFRSISVSQSYLHNHNLREDAKKQYQLHTKNIEKIKKIALKKIEYPEYKDAYNYVDNLFPRANVKEIKIYKVASRDLAKMGYAGAEGFYDRISKIVVVCGARKRHIPVDKRYYIKAKIERDEVIVHELCHYCYVFEGFRSASTEMREEFAYGWSIGYLRQKGYSDEQIIKYNFLPYLVNISQETAMKNIMAQNSISTREFNAHTPFRRKEFHKKYGGKIFLRAKEIAMEKGYDIISLYDKKLEEGSGCTEEDDEELTRFDFLDL